MSPHVWNLGAVMVMCVSGINYTYDEELVVPIVENTPEEKDLKVNNDILYL